MQTRTKAALLTLLLSLGIASLAGAQDGARPEQARLEQARLEQQPEQKPSGQTASKQEAAKQKQTEQQRSEQEQSKQEMRSLDEQVQQIKTDVLSIAADLSRLEEKLLYPSNTQVAIFVSMADGQKFRLDAMQIDIDGRPATRYVYAYKELEALQKGGVQRIYTGNLPTGSHDMKVSVNGVTQSGRDFSHTESFAFMKGVEPKLLGITLAGPETVQVGDW